MNKATIQAELEKRGIHGDGLLDVLDILDEIERVQGIVDDQGIATMFHATTEENATLMLNEQMMFGKEDGLFFSTHANQQIHGYGSVVLMAMIPIEKIELDDDFGDELHFRMKVRPFQKIPVRLSHHLKQN